MAIGTDRLELLMKDKSMEALMLLLDHIKNTYDVSKKEIFEAASGKVEENMASHMPLSAFSSKKLSPLEIIVKYLKEEAGKTYHEIATILNRDDRTIWSTYNNSQKKDKSRLDTTGEARIPISMFSSREWSVLESLSIYLKDELGYPFKKIAFILCKDYQTVYTTYRRGRSKNEA